jgi:hypothetical protein
MSIFPITPLVLRVQGLILEAFDVSPQEAEDHAAGMVGLAEGWSSPETAQGLDWAYLVRKTLGEAKTFKWRSEADRQRFEADQKSKYESYESLIRTRHSRKGK